MNLKMANRSSRSLRGDVLGAFAPDGFSGSVVSDDGGQDSGIPTFDPGGAGLPPRGPDTGVPTALPPGANPSDPETEPESDPDTGYLPGGDPENEDPTTGDIPPGTAGGLIRLLEGLIKRLKESAEIDKENEEEDDEEDDTVGGESGHMGGDKGGTDSSPTETAPHSD